MLGLAAYKISIVCFIQLLHLTYADARALYPLELQWNEVFIPVVSHIGNLSGVVQLKTLCDEAEH